jgi:hypothetical protein
MLARWLPMPQPRLQRMHVGTRWPLGGVGNSRRSRWRRLIGDDDKLPHTALETAMIIDSKVYDEDLSVGVLIAPKWSASLWPKLNTPDRF